MIAVVVEVVIMVEMIAGDHGDGDSNIYHLPNTLSIVTTIL